MLPEMLDKNSMHATGLSVFFINYLDVDLVMTTTYTTYVFLIRSKH
ncbi:hypothetical protein Krac_6207 [Ktedonobacter racemifer DSM 44963]|uniref:Uncharacterized protein n=1 Tax=Ktedonobacter racemifer DSM 44963 TaxID=485913 RepID=D6TY64_KTERA|nr:hypothetical protein Krac_6207 [Ktedonobacter racemifer DSM 44963]